MTETADHEQLRAELGAAALGVLDPEDRQRVLAHVQGCPECDRLFDEYRETVARLALQLPPKPMDPGHSRRLRDRLVSRAGNDAASIRSSSRSPVQWAGWLVAAGLGGVLLVHHSVHRPLAYGWLVAGILLLVIVGLAIHIGAQRRRSFALEERLKRLARQGTLRDHEIEP